MHAAEPVAPVAATPLFNGTNLAGWTEYVKQPATNGLPVWTVRDGVLRAEGQPLGFVRTVGAYRDYRLTLEWRWPEKPTNSGVLLHAEPEDQIWPKSIEAQLMSGKAGDFWLIGGSSLVAHVEPRGKGANLNVPKLAESSEKPPGEWNRYEILCKGASVTLTVNGVRQNFGTNASLTAGHICLQSEGSPIEFRNIVIEPAP